MLRRSETYLDIVWRQFRGHRTAYWSLYVLAALFLLAIFAPLIASNHPLVYRNGPETISPWWNALFNTAEPVDYAFNMALLAFVPWCIVAAALNWRWKRQQRTGRSRLLRALSLYVAFTMLLCAALMVPGWAPLNRYAQRDFTAEHFQAGNSVQAWYAPIPYGPLEQDLDTRYSEPGHTKPAELRRGVNEGFPHVLGTDDTGRDVLVQMLYGTRISMTVGFVAVGIYLTIGCILGALAGYFGGWVDVLISRVIEVVLLFPAFFLILTLVAMIGPSIYIIMVVIGITGWPTIARLMRGEVLKQRGADYATAARAVGASHTRIIFRHILPNSLGPALVSAPFGVAGAIITEAGLSVLGFGVRPPAPSWGTLLRLAAGNYEYWWLVLVPAVAIFITVTAFNLVGNGLRDAMDPRLRAAR